MSTDTFYPDSSDGFLTSNNATYLTCRAGSNLSADTTTAHPTKNVGTSGAYYIYETFLNFDTSSIPDTDTITSVAFLLLLYNGSWSTDTLELRAKDWGDSLTTANWVPGADLAALTLLASHAGALSGLTSFTSEAAFIEAINKTGKTRVILSGAGLRSPTYSASDYLGACFSEHTTPGQRMQLVIEHTAGGGGGGGAVPPTLLHTRFFPSRGVIVHG